MRGRPGRSAGLSETHQCNGGVAAGPGVAAVPQPRLSTASAGRSDAAAHDFGPADPASAGLSPFPLHVAAAIRAAAR